MCGHGFLVQVLARGEGQGGVGVDDAVEEGDGPTGLCGLFLEAEFAATAELVDLARGEDASIDVALLD